MVQAWRNRMPSEVEASTAAPRQVRLRQGRWPIQGGAIADPSARFARSGLWLRASPHAPPALRFRALFDLADALAREIQDLADVAQRELVVLHDSVAELEHGLLFERQFFDGLLHAALLLDLIEVGNARLIDLRRHPRRVIAELVPESPPRLRIRVGVQRQTRQLALGEAERVADPPLRAIEEAADIFRFAREERRDLFDLLRHVVRHAVPQRQHEPLFRREL